MIGERLGPLLRRAGIVDGSGALLARGAVGSLLVMVAGVGIGFLTQLLLARLLGVAAFGLYVFVYTWVRLAGGLARMGVDTSAHRFVAAYREEAEWGRLRAFTAWGRRLSRAAALAFGVPFLVVAWQAAARPDEAPVWLLGALALPLFVALLVEAGFLQGLKRPVQAQLGPRLLQPLLVLVGVGAAALLLDGPLGAIHALLATVVALAAALLLTLHLQRRALPAEVTVAAPAERDDAWWRVSLSMLFITAVNLVQTQTDIAMLGLLLSTDLSGIYSAAAKVAEFVAFGLAAVNAVAGPLIAAHHVRGERARIQRLLRLAAWGVLAFAVVAVTLLALLGPWVLSLFGEAFGAAYGALLILMGGQLLNAFCGSVGVLLMMTGRHGVVAWLMGGSALVNVTLNLLLIPPFGLEGAAAATATTLVLWNLALLWVVVRRLGFNPTVLPLPLAADASNSPIR